MSKKAVSIHVVYDDGSQSIATGSSAASIWAWLLGCEQLNLAHGAVYEGPKFLELEGEVDASATLLP